MNSEKEAK